MELFRRAQSLFESDLFLSRCKPMLLSLIKRTLAWLLVYEVVITILIFPLKWLVDSFNSKDDTWPIVLIGLLLAFSFAGMILHDIMDTYRNSFRELLRAVLKSAGSIKEQSLTASWHTVHGTGEKEAIISKNIERVSHFFEYLLFQACPDFARIVVLVIALAVINLTLGAIAALVLGTVLFIAWWNKDELREMVRDYSDRLKIQDEDGSSLTQNWQVIWLMGQERRVTREYFSTWNLFFKDEVPRHIAWRKVLRRPEVILLISSAIFTSVAYLLVRNESMTIGGFTLVLSLVARMLSHYKNIGQLWRQISMGQQSMDDLLTVFETVPEIVQPANPLWPKSLKGSIEFRDVSFLYEDKEQHALHRINLKIDPYEVVGITGPSGSGKSTLALLVGLAYHTTFGEVIVDGVSLKEIDQIRYRKLITSFVSQRQHLFKDTIRKNISFGRPEATLEEVIAAAKSAHADEFISKLEGNYDHVIGEGGNSLSGGQIQRISIARALLKNPKILIMDEATSSLDAESQSIVQEAIEQRMNQRTCTTLIIAHRFSTIKNVDRIIYLENGRIVESGSHKELLQKGGKYAYMWHLEQNDSYTPKQILAKAG